MTRQFVALLGVVIATLVLSGCNPTFTRVAAPAGARIGIADAMAASGFRNLHIGYMMFGNYDNDLGSDWHLEQRARERTRELLRQAGYQLVDVTLDPMQIKAIRKGEDQAVRDTNGLTDVWRQTYQDILEKQDLAALVVLRDNRLAATEYGPPLVGYGIRSAQGRVPTVGYIFATEMADVIGGNPPHRAVGSCYDFEPLDTTPVHIDNWADAKLSDFEPLRPKFEALLDKRIRFELASAGLLAEPAVCLPPTYPHHPPSRKLQ
jgi:hypothetical protein